MPISRGFASDNCAGVHPKIMKAISDANKGHAVAYGYDGYTKSAVKRFKELFGKEVAVYFVFNGTAANVLSLKAVTESFNSVICAETAHLNTDECGAPEMFTGCKVITIPAKNGKISPDQIKTRLHDMGFEHHAQPRVISITQSTEMGTVYSVKEIREIADLAHQNDLLLHVDGARISNAAASLNVSLEELTFGSGVDVLSFGGTKNGMMFGEAVIFANEKICKDFKYVRKQGMQLASKMRFISAQFDALLSDGLWLENAKHSNSMAKLLLSRLSGIKGIKVTQKVEANAIFATMPHNWIEKLQKQYFFYVWDEEKSEVRWMTSFDTTEEDINNFVGAIRKMR